MYVPPTTGVPLTCGTKQPITLQQVHDGALVSDTDGYVCELGKEYKEVWSVSVVVLLC